VDQMDMLQSYRGEQVQVVTGVTIGTYSVSMAAGAQTDPRIHFVVVQPILANPGYSVTSLVVGTKVRRPSFGFVFFADVLTF